MANSREISTHLRAVSQLPHDLASSAYGVLRFLILIATLFKLASAQAFHITEYTLPGHAGGFPQEIVPGTDGALWFTEVNGIGRIATTGAISEYPLPGGDDSFPYAIVVGPDNALWFTEWIGKIGRITTAGVITEYATPSPDSIPMGIVAGPDGALWFTECGLGKIGRISVGGAITEYPLPASGSTPMGITLGPDGALWFTEWANTYGDADNKIGRITITGTISEYTLGPFHQPEQVITGPDGALWFTDSGPYSVGIGRITTDGTITAYPLPSLSAAYPMGLTVGSDGALWVAEVFGNSIARMTTTGVTTEYAVPTAYSDPWGIAAGPDGSLWFAESNAQKLGRLTVAGLGYTISGTISPAPPSGTVYTAGVAGPVNSTVTTDASGRFVFTGLTNGSYSVIPSLGGYTFTPMSQAVIINGSSQVINFDATSASNTVPAAADLYLTNLTITAGASLYTASNSITAGSGVTISNAGSATFVAGSHIVLSAGFHAVAGTAAISFHAYTQ